jgi:perosamine synthetase
MSANRLEALAPIARNRPTLGEAEASAAARTILSGWVGRGPETLRFENDFGELHGLDSGHAVAVSSGTAALYLALWSLGAAGKRVALPAYACQSLSHAGRMIGAELAFCDSRTCTDPNVDTGELRASGAQIGIAVQSFGIPQALDCGTLAVIEDCGQALGAFYNREPAGLQGAVSVFSFGATKMITAAGGGGALLARDRRLIDDVRDYLTYFDRDGGGEGFNFGFTDVQAAVARVQLRRLNEFRERREALFAIYVRHGIPLIDATEPESRPVRFAAVALSPERTALKRDAEAQGIPIAEPIAQRHLLDGGAAPNAAAFARNAFALPLYPFLSDEQCERVARAVSRYTR